MSLATAQNWAIIFAVVIATINCTGGLVTAIRDSDVGLSFILMTFLLVSLFALSSFIL